jgi:hydroxymethylglutaryl-CoA reductase
MTKSITNSGKWQPGQSGNPRGRKPKGRALTEILRLRGEKTVSIGGEQITAEQALAEVVWQFVLTGEVWLMGNRLKAQNVSEWASVVKWLYSHVEPTNMQEPEEEAQLIVRVTREENYGSSD